MLQNKVARGSLSLLTGALGGSILGPSPTTFAGRVLGGLRLSFPPKTLAREGSRGVLDSAGAKGHSALLVAKSVAGLGRCGFAIVWDADACLRVCDEGWRKVGRRGRDSTLALLLGLGSTSWASGIEESAAFMTVGLSGSLCVSVSAVGAVA